MSDISGDFALVCLIIETMIWVSVFMSTDGRTGRGLIFQDKRHRAVSCELARESISFRRVLGLLMLH